MAVFQVALERGGGILADKTGVRDFVVGFDKSAFPQLPFGLANLPNPFLKLEPSIKNGGVPNPAALVNQTVLLHKLLVDDIELTLPTVEVYSRKHIVETKLAGSDGSLVEIISFQNWALKIRGYVVDESGSFSREYGYYPAAKLKEQIKLFRKNQALKVTSEYLLLFDIHYLVLTDVKFPSMEGYENVFAYEFDAISDKPVELILK